MHSFVLSFVHSAAVPGAPRGDSRARHRHRLPARGSRAHAAKSRGTHGRRWGPHPVPDYALLPLGGGFQAQFSSHLGSFSSRNRYFHTSCWLHRRLGFRTVTASRVSSPRPVFTHGWKRGGGNFQTGTQGTFQHSQYLKAQHSLGN